MAKIQLKKFIQPDKAMLIKDFNLDKILGILLVFNPDKFGLDNRELCLIPPFVDFEIAEKFSSWEFHPISFKFGEFFFILKKLKLA